MRATTAQALIGFGQVRHTRLRPVRHAFAYPTYFLMLPLRSLARSPKTALPRKRFGLISFDDRDHGDGRADALSWIDDLLASQGIHDATGEIWLHTYPRVLGYVFKPVSFWYCHRADGTLAAIVVEVNNTFGERHCYLLSGPRLGWGIELQADKVFHVSPFCKVEGRYRFRFLRTQPEGTHPARTVVRIEHDDAHGPLLLTSVSGTLEPLTRASMRRAFFAHPMMSLGVIARIHWQALRLWIKRVPFFTKPEPPDSLVTR
ncbi:MULTISPECIES: DUF1365 domain-containing protein [Caldimonas]|uniref:DUF1365 domain-containing protein n=1 Tax=Caldimonas TaxID=196013 RepID=UPI00039CDD68|nr:DUF1365 domain-containing protein [Caldimonas manganoxidans]